MAVILSQHTMKQLLTSLLDSRQWSSQSQNASVQPSLEWSSPGSPVYLSLAVFLLMKVHTMKKPIKESFISAQIPSVTRHRARPPTTLVPLHDTVSRLTYSNWHFHSKSKRAKDFLTFLAEMSCGTWYSLTATLQIEGRSARNLSSRPGNGWVIGCDQGPHQPPT